MNILEKASALAGLGRDMISCYRHRISNVLLFATNKCNSNCKICNIWNETPKTDIDIDIIKNILKAKSVEKGAVYGLVGGEFILHKDAERIIHLFNNKKKNYMLFSNCLLADKLIKLVKEYNIPALVISLDGNKETYKRIRGVDGYDSVIRTIKELKGNTKIAISYVINPLNTKDDFLHVKNIAEKNNIELGINIYDRRAIFNTKLETEKAYDLRGIHNSNYLDSYYLWEKGLLILPCFSVRNLLTVMPNGDVPLCQYKNENLGNLNNQRLDDIWINAAEKHNTKKDCNEC